MLSLYAGLLLLPLVALKYALQVVRQWKLDRRALERAVLDFHL